MVVLPLEARPPELFIRGEEALLPARRVVVFVKIEQRRVT
jgi:hypothetical protein